MASLVLTVREAFRYRGRSGQVSWIAHRLAGLAILGFVVIHIWDTANAFFAPNIYAWSLALFKHPLFVLGEIGIMGAVLYHAFNGIRVTLLDYRPEWWLYQKRSALIVWGLFFLIFIPIGLYMFMGLISHCGELASEGLSCWTVPSLSAFPPDMFD